MKSKKILTMCSNTVLHFKNLIKQENSKYVFVGVKGGGCNGLKYYVEPTNNPPEKFDEVVKKDGLSIIICGSGLMYLLGTHISWETNNMGNSLQFSNPNAKSSCGCGETFNT
jgi:iron-sulfur cluster assembly 1